MNQKIAQRHLEAAAEAVGSRKVTKQRGESKKRILKFIVHMEFESDFNTSLDHIHNKFFIFHFPPLLHEYRASGHGGGHGGPRERGGFAF